MQLTRSLPAIAATAISAAIFLDLFAANAAPWSDLIRPVAVVGGFAVVLGLLSSRVMPAVPAGALTVVVTVALVRPEVGPWLGAGGVAWIGARRWAHILFRWGDGRAAELVPFMALVGAGVLVQQLGIAVSAHGFPPILGPAPAAAAGPGGESVYVLFLDGYPRADSLMEDYGYDNEPFLQALDDRGFTVDRQSDTAIPLTPLALANLLKADLSGIEIGDTPSPSTWRLVRTRLNEAPIFDEWRSAGYDVRVIRSPVGHVTVDGSLDTGQVNEFELALLGRSALAPLVGDWAVAQHRERLDAELDLLVDLAAPSRVVIAHVMTPHPPFLTAPPPPCWPECSVFRSADLAQIIGEAVFAERARAQIDYLNPRVLTTLDRLIAADPDAAIIIYSDHGFRQHERSHPDWHRNLYAIRGTPAVEVPLIGP